MSMTPNQFQVYRLRAVSPKNLGVLSGFFLKRNRLLVATTGPADSTPTGGESSVCVAAAGDIPTIYSPRRRRAFPVRSFRIDRSLT